MRRGHHAGDQASPVILGPRHQQLDRAAQPLRPDPVRNAAITGCKRGYTDDASTSATAPASKFRTVLELLDRHQQFGLVLPST